MNDWERSESADMMSDYHDELHEHVEKLEKILKDIKTFIDKWFDDFQDQIAPWTAEEQISYVMRDLRKILESSEFKENDEDG